MIVKALSLWQPHAQAVMLGLKPWETRHWPLRYRGPLAIHAAQRPWNDADPWHREARRRMQWYVERHGAIAWAFGAILGTVDVVDCVLTSELRPLLEGKAEAFWGDFSDGEDGAGRYAFRLENPRPLAKALPWRGQQGLFEVEIEGAAAYRDTMTLPLFGD